MIYEVEDNSFDQFKKLATEGEFVMIQLSYKSVLTMGRNPNTKKVFYRLDQPHGDRHINIAEAKEIFRIYQP